MVKGNIDASSDKIMMNITFNNFNLDDLINEKNCFLKLNQIAD